MARKKRRPRFHGPEVWLRARVAYLDGADAAECEERFGIREQALRRRARLEGWTRRQHFGDQVARTPGVPEHLLTVDPAVRIEDLRPVALAETALMRAWEALSAGRPKDATAMTKAASELGEFAEVLLELKRRRAERNDAASDAAARDWGVP